jgi:hypothetical protein
MVASLALLAPAGWDMAEAGDSIYFKDGMRTVCKNRAWEEKDEVHCEYEGVVLVYPKSDVIRIEKGPPLEDDRAGKTNPARPMKPAPGPAAALSPLPAAAPSAAPKSSSGVLFYDPRRAKKYWSSPTGHHDSYRDAVAALAAEFDRPAQWIEENMGDTNDLGEIRDNLSSTKQPAPAAPVDASDGPTGGGIEFYNPRRPQKYWTAQDARHPTFEEALRAFAREFGKPTDWIEAHMGDSNDLEQMRNALRDAQLEEKTK